MGLQEPVCNEFQKVLRVATEAQANPPALPPNSRHIFRELPDYHLTPLTEWGACLYAKDGTIKAKSHSGLVTYYSRYPQLDWTWLQRVHPDWICCPVCGLSYPKDARYWWWRDRGKGYLWLNACRNCKCKSHRRVKDKKRLTRLTVQN